MRSYSHRVDSAPSDSSDLINRPERRCWPELKEVFKILECSAQTQFQWDLTLTRLVTCVRFSGETFLLLQAGWENIQNSKWPFIKTAFESFKLKLTNRLIISANTIAIDKSRTVSWTDNQWRVITTNDEQDQIFSHQSFRNMRDNRDEEASKSGPRASKPMLRDLNNIVRKEKWSRQREIVWGKSADRAKLVWPKVHKHGFQCDRDVQIHDGHLSQKLRGLLSRRRLICVTGCRLVSSTIFSFTAELFHPAKNCLLSCSRA
jgi:hypothetical protein